MHASPAISAAVGRNNTHQVLYSQVCEHLSSYCTYRYRPIPPRCRQLHPKLLEGLDAALATLEPMKTTDAQSVTEQLFLKAFRNSPGASAELQQILACNTEAAAAILARMQPLEAFGEVGGSIKGDYLVLQTPIIQTPAAPLKQGAKSALPRPTAPKPPAAPQQKPAASEVSTSLSTSVASSTR